MSWSADDLAKLALKRAGAKNSKEVVRVGDPMPGDPREIRVKQPPVTSDPSPEARMRPGELHTNLRIMVRQRGTTKWDKTTTVVARMHAAQTLREWREGRAAGQSGPLVLLAKWPAELHEFSLRREPAQ